MSTPREKFYPGWKMTHGQHGEYWRMLGRVCVKVGATTAAQREDARQQIHLRAFGSEPDGRTKSARAINHLKDFDDFKAACLAVLSPTSVEAQLRQAEMPRTRAIYAIRQLAPEAYIIAEAKRKFGAEDWESLGESELTMLRNHLAARAAHLRWPKSANADPELAAV